MIELEPAAALGGDGTARLRAFAGRPAICVALSVVAFALIVTPATADEPALPSPLDATSVVRLARERRAEVAAARARAAAASERPKIVSALPNPMVAVTVQHLPFNLSGVNGSVTVQQEFPLSGVLGDRRRVAEAQAEGLSADTLRVGFDVELEALQAFYVLAERRETAAILDEQIAITGEVVAIARAHLAVGQGMLADVLRLDNEMARFRTDRSALDPDIRGAEAMLDTVLAREPTAPIPQLVWSDDVSDPPALPALSRQALAQRPELVSARAERRSALAEVDTMRSMYKPMALVRAGPSYMTPSGPGVMAMVGLTIPLWHESLAAGVNEAEAMVTQASAGIAAMERTISGNIAVAREHVLAERIRVLALRQDIVPRARLVVTSATGSFAAGQAPMLPVLDASRDLRDLRMQEIMARGRLSTAWATLWRETAGAAGPVTGNGTTPNTVPSSEPTGGTIK